MTTDEALEFCKRLDDPKFQSLIGTDLSRATGTTGALLALRAEIKTLRDRINSEIDDLMRHYHSDEHTLVNVGVQAQRLMSILRGGN